MPLNTTKTQVKKAFVLLFLVVSLFLNISIVPLTFEEPRRALIALEMLISGNPIVPTLNGTFYLNKPPLYNWTIESLYFFTGNAGAWEGRFVTIVSFLAVAALLYLVVRKYLNGETAFFAALFWLTSSQIYFHFSFLGEIDLFYTLLVFIQAIAIFHFFEKKNFWLLFTLSYFFMALGFLTKGLPSIVFQGFTLLAVFIYGRSLRKLFSLAHVTGFLFGGFVIFFYFYAYSQYNSPWPFLMNLIAESSDRTAASFGVLKLAKNLLLFPFLHIKIIMPWGIFLFLFFKRNIREDFFENPFTKFCLIFIGVNILPYMLSPGTRDRYLYIFVPFIMTFAAHLVHRFYLSSVYKKYFDGLFLITIMALAVVSLCIPFIKLFHGLAFIWPVGIVFFLVFAVLTGLFVKMPKQRIWLFLYAWVGARILFDLTILPCKVHSAAVRRPYEAISAEIADLAKGSKVFAYGPVEENKDHIPFLGDLEIATPILPYFSLSYYYSAKTGQIMEFSAEKIPGRLYVSDVGLVENENIEILKKYYVIEHKKTYALFTFKTRLQESL